MNLPELLAPVGSQEALIAAVQNGADAIYMGGKMFSARQYANNFDHEELKEAIDYAHIRGVKVYITVNTILANSEFPEVIDYLRFLNEAGADAIIVQDLGVATVAQTLFPGLELHASTQMTVHSSSGVEMLKSYGFKRIVLARELSLREISIIKDKTGVELEVFIHGALCVSYSGQCLMSSMIGGRSGNRGRCAQPCRMEYSFVDLNGNPLVSPENVGLHLLSPMDLNMIEHIPNLVESGVSSLKIEGRMKRPEYVAIVTGIYRKALDKYAESPTNYSVDPKEIKRLAQIFNRGFTTGYFFGKQGTDMMSFKRPNNRGLRLGRVTRSDWSKNMVDVLLEDTLRQGDGIEFWVTEGGRKGITVGTILLNGKKVEEALKGQNVSIKVQGKIKPGDRVFKTHDVELMLEAEQSYKSTRELKNINLQFQVKAHVNTPFEITVTDNDGNSFVVISDFLGQVAINKPLTLDYLRKQIDRLGNTPYVMEGLVADLDDNVMVPASEINEARRKAIEGLTERRLMVNKPQVVLTDNFFEMKNKLISESIGEVPKVSIVKETAPVLLTVRAANFEQLQAAVRHGADVVYFSNLAKLDDALDLCKSKGMKLVISSPRIIREDEMSHALNLLSFAKRHQLPVLASNLGILQEALRLQLDEIYADYFLNIYNSFTLGWLEKNAGIDQAALSPELTLSQIAEITQRASVPLEVVVEGHLPLMVTDYCPSGTLLGNMNGDSKCGRNCETNKVRGFKDRLGLIFPFTHDEFCRTSIFNAKELSMIEDIVPLSKAGITRFRLEMSIEDIERTTNLVRYWRNELDHYMADRKNYKVGAEIKEKIAAMSPAGLTKGHFYRGVE